MYPVLISTILFATRINDLLYSVPLVVAISLVYAASRYEELDSILAKAWWFGTRCAFAMIVAFALFYVLTVNL